MNLMYSTRHWAVPEKEFAVPYRGGWISRLFVVKYSPGFPSVLDKNPYFHTDFHKKKKKKNHTGTQNPHCIVFSLWISRKILHSSKWESRLFCIPSTDIIYGGGNNLFRIAQFALLKTEADFVFM